MKLITSLLVVLFVAAELDAHHKKQKIKKCKKDKTFPENMELKYFQSLISRETSPNFFGSVHTLMCPLLNKDLEKELLCGLDPAYSTSNVIIYSGSINNVYPFMLNIFCIDLVVHNKLENVNTKYIWHGKCFVNVPLATEVFLQHDLNFEKTMNSTVYSMNFNNKEIYKATLPALNDKNYKTYHPDEDEYLSTSHFHMFDYFGTKEVKEYCPNDFKLGTSLMTINFGQMDKVYMKRLDNLNDIFIDENFGKNFGFTSPFNKDSLDNTNCVASFWNDMKYMDTGRIVAVDKSVSVPPSQANVSLSTTETIPKPFDNMNRKLIKKMGVLTEVQKSKSFDINNALMDYFYDNEL